MTKPNDDEAVEFILYGRSEYLDRLLKDLENGRIELSDHEGVDTAPDLEYSPAGRVWLPGEVYDGVESIRRSGVINMADWAGVIALAEVLEMHEAVAWLRANPVGWMTAIIKGAERKPLE